MKRAVVLVVAKAPVVGQVKTRLGVEVGMRRAAELAAVALLDTLAAAEDEFGADRCHLALTGDLETAVLSAELLTVTRSWTVHPQRGNGLARRLRNAHQDVAAATLAPVVQVGMDTPQLDPAILSETGSRLTGPRDAVLGPAYDGGWWLLGVGSPELVAHLDDVAMSTPRTCAATLRALHRARADVTTTVPLHDVDTAAAADLVAGESTGSRFADAWALMAGARR